LSDNLTCDRIDKVKAARSNGVSEMSRIGNIRGVCLAELVVGTAVGIIVLAASLEVLHVAQSAVGGKQRSMAQRQDLRLGLEVFEQDVRLATAESFVSATRDTVEFSANINAQHTTTTAIVLPGQSVLPVLDGSGWGKGKTVVLCGQTVCERHRLSRAGRRSRLTLAGPVVATFSAGASVEVSNRVVYYIKEGEGGAINLMRMVDGGANVLIGELKTVLFSYRDKRGRVASNQSEVARVLIEIEPKYSRQREKRGVALRS
jgi:hypothetical protein